MCCIVQTRIRSTTLLFYPLQPSTHTPPQVKQLTTIIKSSWSSCPGEGASTKKPPQTTKAHSSPKSNSVAVQCNRGGGLAAQETTKCLFIHIKGRPNIDQLTFSYLKESLLRAYSYSAIHPLVRTLQRACTRSPRQVLTKRVIYSWAALEGSPFKFIIIRIYTLIVSMYFKRYFQLVKCVGGSSKLSLLVITIKLLVL